jgi:hypothetical protein
MTCEQVCVLVDVDEGNNEGVCDDMLDMEKIVTLGVCLLMCFHCRSREGCIVQVQE